MLFSLHKRKEPKEVCQRAVGSLSARVRKARKLFAKAHAMRGTFCSAQGYCAAYGSFGGFDLAATLRIRAGCLCPIAYSPNSGLHPHRVKRKGFSVRRQTAKQEFIFLAVQKKSAPYSPCDSSVCAHTARRRVRETGTRTRTTAPIKLKPSFREPKNPNLLLSGVGAVGSTGQQ